MVRRASLQTEQAQCRYGVLRWPSGDEILGRSLRQYGEWAQAEIDLLLHFLRPQADVVDVGAFVGTHTAAFAAQDLPGCTVHAFEAHPDYVSILRTNVESNRLPRVKVHPVALSDESGRVAQQELGATTKVNYGGVRFGNAPDRHGTLSVRARTLDQLRLTSCALIKIDVEGMELRVIRGAEQTLRTQRPAVYVECNTASEGWPVIEHMRARDYSCRLHCFPAYNPANFRGDGDNFFGAAREVGLLFLPRERMTGELEELIARSSLAPIASLDDLVLGLLRKPQYKSEVLAHSVAAQVLGFDFWLNESEAECLRLELVALGERLDRTQVITLSIG